MKNMDYGKGYKYSHSFEGNFAEQEYLPDKIAGTTFYDPQNNAREVEIRKFLKEKWKDKYGYWLLELQENLPNTFRALVYIFFPNCLFNHLGRKLFILFFAIQLQSLNKSALTRIVFSIELNLYIQHLIVPNA